MTEKTWNALVLAAGRGPDDPMARAYGVANKCLLQVGGTPMVVRVVTALQQSQRVTAPVVVSEAGDATAAVLGQDIRIVTPAGSAPGSVLQALARGDVVLPLLVTTGDHALLTPQMVQHFCDEAARSAADFSVGLARAETILAAYPDTRRTFFRLGPDRVSGCNLFAIRNPRGLALIERWQGLEQLRKKPWRLISELGIGPLVSFALGRLSLNDALALVSRKLGMTAAAVFMPFAEAAIDVDKPADKDLAERILAARHS